MLKGPVDHVGHRLESSMGMPGSAFGLARRIFDLPHLVEMDEGIELLEGNVGKSPSDWKALTFEAALGGRDRFDRTLVLTGIGDDRRQ
jgi:hypothetical protein